jgi:hypothetical protein
MTAPPGPDSPSRARYTPTGVLGAGDALAAARGPRAPQSYANHRRFFPLFHAFALPVLLANVAVQVAETLRVPTWDHAWAIVVALALVGGLVASRASTLVVQNRLIALEMRLRLATVLPPDQRMLIPALQLRHLVGLRFASDAELPGLVARCLSGELATTDAVKRAIREWRPDYLRA